MVATPRAHLRRLVLLLAAIIGVNFLLPRLLPGSPMALGAAPGDAAPLPGAAIAEMRRVYGLDDPPARQLARYLHGLVRGDLGTSLATHRPVAAMLRERLPWTLLLTGSAMTVSLLLGATLATLTVWRPNRAAARGAAALLVGVGMLPEFLLAMIVIALGTRWGMFPIGGATSPFLTVPEARDVPRAVLDVVAHMALPTATLVMAFVPAIYLVSRNALSAVAGDRYLMTARGKGLSERRVLWHAWRNALPPVLTLLGVRFAFAVTGVVIVERIFAYPGVGLLLFESVVRRDYPVMQGVFLVASAITVAVTVVLDLAAGVVDPRIWRENS